MKNAVSPPGVVMYTTIRLAYSQACKQFPINFFFFFQIQSSDRDDKHKLIKNQAITFEPWKHQLWMVQC